MLTREEKFTYFTTPKPVKGCQDFILVSINIYEEFREKDLYILLIRRAGRRRNIAAYVRNKECLHEDSFIAEWLEKSGELSDIPMEDWFVKTVALAESIDCGDVPQSVSAYFSASKKLKKVEAQLDEIAAIKGVELSEQVEGLEQRCKELSKEKRQAAMEIKKIYKNIPNLVEDGADQ